MIRNGIHDYAASLVDGIEQRYGIRVEYDSISPSFLTILSVEGLRIFISSETNEPGFSEIAVIDSLQIRYNYRELLFKPRMVSSLKITADTVSVSADFDTLSAYLERYSDQFAGDSKDVFELPDIRADIRKAVVSAEYEGITVTGTAESIYVSNAEKTSNLLLSYYDSELMLKAENLIEIENRYEPDQLKLQTSGISTFQLAEHSLEYSADRVSVFDDRKKILDEVPLSLLSTSELISGSLSGSGFELILDYSADKNQLTGSFDTEDLFYSESADTAYLFQRLFPGLEGYNIEKMHGASVSVIMRMALDENTEESESDGFVYSGKFQVPAYQKDAVSLQNMRASFSGSSSQIVLHELSASSDEMQFSFTGALEFDGMNPSGTASLSLPENSFINETIEIDIEKAPAGIQDSLDFSFSLNEGTYQIYSRLDYSNFSKLSILPTIKTSDHFYYMPFTLDFDEKFVYSHDESDITFSFDYSSSERQHAIVQWKNAILPLKEFSGIDDISTSGRMIFLLSDDGQWNLQLSQFTVPDIRPLEESPDYVVSLNLNAFITDDLIQLRNIELLDPSGSLEGSGSIDYSLADRQFNQAQIELSDSQQEKYQVNFRQEDAFINASVNISQGNLSRFPGISAEGQLNGTVEIAGNTDNLNYTIELSTDNAVLFGQNISGAVNASISSNNFSIYSQSVTMNSISFENVSAFYDFGNGKFDSSFDVTVEAEKQRLQTAVTATSVLPKVSGIQELIQSGESLLNTSIDISTSEIRLGDRVLAEKLDAVAGLRNKRLLLRGENNSFSGYADLKSQNMHLIVNAAYPFSGVVHGSWHNGEIELFLNDIAFDLQYLNSFTNGQIVFENSIINGYLTISGNMADPDFYGELYSDSIEISNQFLEHPFIGTNVYAAVHGKEIDFTRFNASVHEVPVETQLAISIEKWIPSLFSISFSIPKEKPVQSAYVFENIRLSYDGKISGDLGIEFNTGSSELEINGNLLMDTMEITQFPHKGKKAETNENSISVDMTITTGRNVRFILPNKELPILTATAEPQQKLRFDYTSKTDSFNVIGSINIKSGEIYYFKRNFYISSGNISLSETENNFNPLISLEAQLREFDRNANRVNIILRISNQQLGNLTPIIGSNPPMELNEIAQILGANILTTNPDSSGTLSSAVAVATLASDIAQQLGFIDQLNVFNNLEQKVRNTLNLDVFSIRTQIIENVLYDVFPGESRYNASENPIGKYFDNTTVLLGKYISENMFLQTMLQFNLNDTTGSGLFMTDALQMDMELSFDWQNPLYDFTISTTPDLSSINSILANTAVGISWNYNF